MKNWNEIIKDCVQDPKNEKGEIIAKDVATLDCIPAVFQNIIFGAFLFAGIITVILIIYSGIRFITSGGDPKQVEGARKTLTYAIIGFIVILLSFAILNLISTITGVNCIKFFGFKNCV